MLVGCWHFRMPVPTVQVFDTAGHNHPVLYADLHNTVVNFFHGELLFLHTNIVPL
jgi:hypothetical protein